MFKCACACRTEPIRLINEHRVLLLLSGGFRMVFATPMLARGFYRRLSSYVRRRLLAWTMVVVPSIVIDLKLSSHFPALALLSPLGTPSGYSGR